MTSQKRPYYVYPQNLLLERRIVIVTTKFFLLGWQGPRIAAPIEIDHYSLMISFSFPFFSGYTLAVISWNLVFVI